ncbi:MAG TPA: ribosome silencing factor [Paludibacteraceae bacterium]|jgi:ribosome-associated protein|nr:ribosome silencing factor [Paludibacteraceae bacterium]MDS1032838.1 ribosome silencing factor [Porphyromonadaceae sp. NP-X]NLJ19780.1 ribosome silencing factor [Bacteroidales bacterium]MBP9016539.1 ribosome silencing factor [Paludibacteraceae bacterium]HNZ61679.1 ribosome silencing factor [Paludibacteraceae bacterium]
MRLNEQIVKEIVDAIQDKKGKNIVVINLSSLKDAPCSYFVICEGTSSIHVNSIEYSIKDDVNKRTGVKPYAVDGLKNSEWVAMDYGHVIVHVFQPQVRSFYKIEQLWEDAEIIEVPDID